MARSDIDALNARCAEAFEKGDAALIASVYAPDARVLPREPRRWKAQVSSSSGRAPWMPASPDALQG